MNEDDFLICIAKALEINVNKISLGTTSDDLEEWDSLGHLTILFALDKETEGSASKIDGLSAMTNLGDIFNALN
tara:strand:+ start:3076 stop:3297 length:222 start_codon:yes stop_codon:yes gene_type:complete